MPSKAKSEFEQAMEEWETPFAEGREEYGGEMGVLPDGDYQAKIKVSRVDRTPWNDDEYQFSILFEVENKGSVWLNLSLNGGIERVKFTGGVLARLGYEGTLAELEEIAGNGFFDDLVCDIKVQTKAGTERDFTNVYVNRCHGKMEATKVNPDDDIPF